MTRTAIVLLAVAALDVRAQESESASVERHLSATVVLKGRENPRYSLVDRMKTYRVPGVSIAVIHRNQIAWAKGYGVADRSTGKAVEPGTLFQAGSISKPVAAAGALKLAESGKLSLDENVNVKLRSWKVPDNEFTTEEKVTIRRLVSHTAGLTVHGFPGYAAANPIPTLVQVLDGARPANTPPVRVNATPGSIWRYSGGGYTILQLLMQDVSGESFPVLLRRLVLAPLGMSLSSYEQPLARTNRNLAATGYNAAGQPIDGNYHTYPEMAAAGLWTTPSDLALFAIELQAAREGRSAKVLSQATVNEMMKVQKGNWGLGFGIKPTPVKWFFHGGADEGFRAELIASFDGEGIVVMTNSDNGAGLAKELIQSAAEVYGWRGFAPQERETAAVDAARLKSFEGQYRSPQLGVGTVRVDGDHLRISSALFEDLDFYAASPTHFFPLTSAFPDIDFVLDAQGEVTAVKGGPVTAVKVK